ncbi:DUF2336 domain-containing protein [Stakelama tenebrarum]|uniref:DUF2336 domain-containing protein n=1 Tax=Stakelama tenebrarum TaxID=2711215 RepID=A0A6G6Y6V1_9SPHN|nr:DUF2336 domain-containing protein [Sphingosinithalassobacter tenebrarum]QIG80438.1 DUF2336 domain-containing protein [Sphingosinithalassobacter tenebrarum]
MSDNPVDMRDGATIGANKLLARAAAEEMRAFRTLMVAVDDFFLPEESRLDERTRSALTVLLRGLVETVESEVRAHAVRLLSSRNQPDIAGALGAEAPPVMARLMASGLLRDSELMAELMARVRQELLGAALPMQAPDDPERPSLINRYVQHPDRVLAAGAMDVMIAESRRRGSPETGQLSQTDLPAELHHKLVWWVAAALRERTVKTANGAIVALDQALTEAAQRSLAAYDEGDRLEAAALRFASAVDAQPAELPQLLVESLGDRRIVLFTAFLGHALGIGYSPAREMVLDPGGERLWVALRALDCSRDAIAQIGYAFCESDPRRDLEALADRLDEICTIPPAEAREALAPLRLHPDYRAALLALERSGGEG